MLPFGSIFFRGYNMKKKIDVKKVIIVGGGTAGWMTAAMLSKLLGTQIEITLVESTTVGTVGVGEATIPSIQLFNSTLGINETDFVKATQASFKLGIQFEGWGNEDSDYMHAFGVIGKDLGLSSFHYYWLQQAESAKKFWDHSLNYQTAKANKFSLTKTQNEELAYAYHFDANLYAQYLKKISLSQGVKCVEGFISEVRLNDESGFIQEIELETGEILSADLFIDCSGFKGLLIEQALNTGFDDWSDYLPCDHAWAVPSEKIDSIKPYTRSIARDAGWQWQIPLQHRVGNGLVFSSTYMSPDTAKKKLIASLPSKPLAEPKLIKFKTGMRKKQWNKNCVAIGLSSGFLEPLESTSIHLIQSAILRLIQLFPKTITTEIEDEFNHLSRMEFEEIRDFIILHYHLNNRRTSFWKYCREMDIPESLSRRIRLFTKHARTNIGNQELFSATAWQQVMIGQGIIPENNHPISNVANEKQTKAFMQHNKLRIREIVKGYESHESFFI